MCIFQLGNKLVRACLKWFKVNKTYKMNVSCRPSSIGRARGEPCRCHCWLSQCLCHDGFTTWDIWTCASPTFNFMRLRLLRLLTTTSQYHRISSQRPKDSRRRILGSVPSEATGWSEEDSNLYLVRSLKITIRTVVNVLVLLLRKSIQGGSRGIQVIATSAEFEIHGGELRSHHTLWISTPANPLASGDFHATPMR